MELPEVKPIAARVAGHTQNSGELLQALEFLSLPSTRANDSSRDRSNDKARDRSKESGHPMNEYDINNTDEHQHRTSRAPTETGQYYNQSEHSDSRISAIAKSRKVNATYIKYLADDQHGHNHTRNEHQYSGRSSSRQSSALSEEKQWYADIRHPNQLNATSYNQKHHSDYYGSGHPSINFKEKDRSLVNDHDTHDSMYGHTYKKLNYFHPQTYVDQGNINITGVTYMNEAYIPRGKHVSTQRLEQSSADNAVANIFSRGNSPPDVAKDNLHDYTAEWVNDQSRERVRPHAPFHDVTNMNIC